jgi:SAM-dependent methyltransferase
VASVQSRDSAAAPDPEWEAFAAREPYFAILSAAKYRRANLSSESLSEFFESGDALVDWIFRTIELRIVPRFSPVSILEYGCGVGRLAIPLAKRGGRVTAVDRSPAMLAVAKQEAERHAVPHIEFLSSGELAADRKFDLIVSHLVFQRLPEADGLRLLSRLLSHLGPGGVGVFQFDTSRRPSMLVSVSRLLRRALPGVNAAANLALGKAAREPFLPSHSCDFDAVLRVLDEHRMDPTYVSSGREEQAVVFAQAPVAAELSVTDRRTTTTAAAPASISAEDIVGATSIEELNRLAEAYFSTLKEWDHHLAKPFADIEEAPDLLTDVAVLLRGLRLPSGARIVDFGSGPGWLARLLTQLGCETILLDVSPTALAIARTLYERLPVVGDRPRPAFLVFDGRRIDLPDASVDRIVSFHAFHHVPNPEGALAEFGRILKPGGIAGFVEPGPRHSETPVSQFEMRTYGVVERDIDVHAIWRAAARGGFASIELAVWHAPAFHLSLERYEDFLAGGSTGDQWLTATRDFARHVRTFFLKKEGAERADSRGVAGLACAIHVSDASIRSPEGSAITVDARVTNTGTAAWLPSTRARGSVWLGGHLHMWDGGLVAFDAARAALSDPARDILPGESAAVRLTLPPQRAGRYRLELDCVSDGVTWFAQIGSPPAAVEIDVLRA